MINRIKYGEFSHKGIRKENQDSYLTNVMDNFAIFSVADGMGGYKFGGEVSSTIMSAIKNEILCCRNFSIEYMNNMLYRKYFQINDFIMEQYKNKSILAGSTLSTLCLIDGKFIAINVGDTRISRIRRNELKTISKIHNVAAEKFENGSISYQQYMEHKDKNILTQCIGIDKNIKPYEIIGNCYSGDYFIICSDGVYNYLHDDDFLDAFLGAEILKNEDMMRICKELVNKAYANGSDDNMTMVGIKIE